MEVTINGKKRACDSPVTVAGLLHSLGINPRSVAVELNFRIIARDDMEREMVRDGDTLEIIRFVGGG